MKSFKELTQEFSLIELLQEVQSRTSTEAISVNQQQQMTQIMIHILQAYAKVVERPLPGQDIHEIRGQAHVKRALEVSAAGHHNILLVGPSGAGKTLLARTFPSLLPTTSLSYPFREPPASIERETFLGDTTSSGELTLAHGGVLFLKNLDMFDLSLLTSLAQTVETGVVCFPRPVGRVVLPAKFVLVATVKPCPCGFFGVPGGTCVCSTEEIVRYRQPLKEIVRTCFAIEIEVSLLVPEIFSIYPEESSADIRQRVEAARAIQQKRYAGIQPLQVNADLRSVDEIQYYCQIDSVGEQLLRTALQQLNLTPLQMLRLQGVARTIADLAGSPTITGRHLAEAIQYLSRFVRLPAS